MALHDGPRQAIVFVDLTALLLGFLADCRGLLDWRRSHAPGSKYAERVGTAVPVNIVQMADIYIVQLRVGFPRIEPMVGSRLKVVHPEPIIEEHCRGWDEISAYVQPTSNL